MNAYMVGGLTVWWDKSLGIRSLGDDSGQILDRLAGKHLLPSKNMEHPKAPGQVVIRYNDAPRRIEGDWDLYMALYQLLDPLKGEFIVPLYDWSPPGA